MFMPVVDIPERLRGEPAPVAAVGPVLAVVFREILDQPTPGEMQQLLHRVRERDGLEPYWRRFYSANDNSAP